MLGEIMKRASTSDPFNNQQDSLFDTNLFGQNEFAAEHDVSIDEEDSKRKTMKNERNFVQRLKTRVSREHLMTRQNEVDSVLSIVDDTVENKD